MPADMNCLTATPSPSFVRARNADPTRHSGARRNQGVNRRSGTSRTHTSPSCRINRVATERDIRLKVGRYRLRARHDERHPSRRLRSGRPVQDRIIAKARANASDSRGRAYAAEKTLYIHQAKDLVLQVSAWLYNSQEKLQGRIIRSRRATTNDPLPLFQRRPHQIELARLGRTT